MRHLLRRVDELREAAQGDEPPGFGLHDDPHGGGRFQGSLRHCRCPVLRTVIRGAHVFLLTLGVAATGIVSSQLGCETDFVKANVMTPAVCGNGIVQQGEQCDTPSPGCVNCQIAPEWTCPENVCSPDCNDPGIATSVPPCTR